MEGYCYCCCFCCRCCYCYCYCCCCCCCCCCFNFQSGGMVCSEVQVDALEKMAISSPTPTTSCGCSLCRSWALLYCLIIVINVVADATGLYFIFTLSLLYFIFTLSLQMNRSRSFLCLFFLCVKVENQAAKRAKRAHWLYAIFISLQSFPIHTDNGLKGTGRWVWSASWFQWMPGL